MDQLAVVVSQGRKIYEHFPETHPTSAYGSSAAWTAMYLALRDFCGFEAVLPDDSFDRSRHMEYVLRNEEGLEELLSHLRVFAPDLCLPSRDALPAWFRMVAGRILLLTNPQLPLVF